jgi:hypothetical protein
MPKRFALALCLPLLAGCGSIFIDAPSGTLPAAPAPVTVNVSIRIDQSVTNRSFVITGPGAPITLTNFTVTPTSTQNRDQLTTTVSLPAGSYTLTARGDVAQWDGSNAPQNVTSSFTVVAATGVSLMLSPSGDILVPRNGSNSAISLAVSSTGTTGSATLTASGLPSGVSFSAAPNPVASGSTATGTLTATATADGTSTATIKATIGTQSGSTSPNVVVVPAPGTVSWVAAPFLTGTGPQTPTSPDGKWKISASRMGASRVWTLHIAPVSGNATPLDVTTAQWGGNTMVPGSNLAGIAFCPSTTSPTLSAMVLSDEDETPNPVNHANPVAYRLKVIRFSSGAPVLVNASIDGLFFLSATQPKLGFSPDCSIVGGWTIDMQGGNNRIATFMDIFNGHSTSQWSYTDTATSPPAGLAKISGTTLTLTPPNGPASTKTVP